ncbi:hypothetical protein D0868_01695 [Hortaea werneckii]|uniref:RRM domain-containing protein n=1 Tax=Hortaea werneckii TaxID=91943 RepID=A0A3M6ZFT7_HORWE|nr:hypothetical protein D0868_01695 [Hortaea werneckii]
MQSVRQVQRLNDLELQKVVPPNASWHTDYRDTAYIYIGGLPFELSEGDVLTIFSQYGNPVHINLVRDKETGKSKGFAFLKYEDQRSCDLAVDNLSGAGVMGRLISVDHTRYKKKEGEIETVGDETEDGDETDKEGAARSKRRRTESESEEERPMIKEEVELAKLKNSMEDDDPMKAYMIQEKQAEVEDALKAVSLRKSKDKDRERRHKHKHHHRIGIVHGGTGRTKWTENVMGDGVGDRKQIVRQDQILKTEEHKDTHADRVEVGQLRQNLIMTGEEGGKEAIERTRCLTTEVGVVSATGDDRFSRY